MYEVAQALHIQRMACMDAAILCQSLQAGSRTQSLRQQMTYACQGLLAPSQLLQH